MLARLGRVFFGIALVAFGVQQFLFGDFVAGRAPAWPASLPGRLAWAYLSGAVLIACGFAIVVNRKARPAALVAGAMIFAWALLRHLPLALADRDFGGAWTSLGKALALCGGALGVAALSRGTTYAARACLGAFLIAAGIQHFLFAGFVMTLVPAWIPGPRFWTYFAGVALIAGGAGLQVPRTARLAGAFSGLMIFLWLLMLHIPRALAAPEPLLRNEWTAVFEALAMSGIAFLLAGEMPLQRLRAESIRPAK